MKKIIYFVVLFALVLSCTSNTIYKKPNDLIEKDLMVELITQIQIANSARNSKNLNEERSINYLALVYQNFGIDSARFTRSNFYYSTRIDDYTEIMQRVKSDLKEMKDFQDSIVKVSDSIKRINNKLKRLEKKKAEKLKDSLELLDAVVK